jgi:hypothetical protein
MPLYIHIRRVMRVFWSPRRDELLCAGSNEMWLMEQRRRFLDDYSISHAGAQAPPGSWARVYPHLAHSMPGACLAIR